MDLDDVVLFKPVVVAGFVRTIDFCAHAKEQKMSWIAASRIAKAFNEGGQVSIVYDDILGQTEGTAARGPKQLGEKLLQDLLLQIENAPDEDDEQGES